MLTSVVSYKKGIFCVWQISAIFCLVHSFKTHGIERQPDFAQYIQSVLNSCPTQAIRKVLEPNSFADRIDTLQIIPACVSHLHGFSWCGRLLKKHECCECIFFKHPSKEQGFLLATVTVSPDADQDCKESVKQEEQKIQQNVTGGHRLSLAQQANIMSYMKKKYQRSNFALNVTSYSPCEALSKNDPELFANMALFLKLYGEIVQKWTVEHQLFLLAYNWNFSVDSDLGLLGLCNALHTMSRAAHKQYRRYSLKEREKVKFVMPFVRSYQRSSLPDMFKKVPQSNAQAVVLSEKALKIDIACAMESDRHNVLVSDRPGLKSVYNHGTGLYTISFPSEQFPFYRINKESL